MLTRLGKAYVNLDEVQGVFTAPACSDSDVRTIHVVLLGAVVDTGLAEAQLELVTDRVNERHEENDRKFESSCQAAIDADNVRGDAWCRDE